MKRSIQINLAGTTNSRPTGERSFPRLSSRYSPRRCGIATRTPESARQSSSSSAPRPSESRISALLFDSRFEVISADSMQVYRHMDVGTAKLRQTFSRRSPTTSSSRGSSDQFNAGRFVKAAETLVFDIRAGKIPGVRRHSILHHESSLRAAGIAPSMPRSVNDSAPSRNGRARETATDP